MEPKNIGLRQKQGISQSEGKLGGSDFKKAFQVDLIVKKDTSKVLIILFSDIYSSTNQTAFSHENHLYIKRFMIEIQMASLFNFVFLVLKPVFDATAQTLDFQNTLPALKMYIDYKIMTIEGLSG